MRTRTRAAIAVVILLLVGLIVAVQSVLACRCTPGFWKNHTELWPLCATPPDNPFHLDPDMTLSDVGFATPYGDDLNGDGDADTLFDALKYKGGKGFEGAARILLRAGVAALLNEQCHYKWWADRYTWAENVYPIPYLPFVGTPVVDLVNGALGSCDRHTMLRLAEDLDNWNNYVCKEPCDTWPDCPNE